MQNSASSLGRDLSNDRGGISGQNDDGLTIDKRSSNTFGTPSINADQIINTSLKIEESKISGQKASSNASILELIQSNSKE